MASLSYSTILDNLQELKRQIIVSTLSKYNSYPKTKLKYLTKFIQATVYPYNKEIWKTKTTEHEIAIVTAGKTFIYGYGEKQNHPCFSKPCILFDDFTTDCKYIDIPFYFPSSAGKIILNNKNTDIKWLYYTILSLRGTVETKDHGRHWIEVYSNIEVPNIPLHEQQIISKYLDEKIKYLDEKIKYTLSLKESLEKLKYSLISEKIKTCANKFIPSKRFFSTKRGLVLSVDKISNLQTDIYKYPVYSSQTTNDGLVGFYNSYLFEKSITWTTDGAKAGTFVYRDKKYFATNVCGTLTPISKNIDSKFYCYCFMANSHEQKIDGAMMPRMMGEDVQKILLPLVDITTQNKIAVWLDKKISWLDSKIKLLGGKNE